MDVHVTLFGFGDGNTPMEHACSMPAPATVADLMRLMGLRSHETMLVFVGHNMAQEQTPLQHGDRVHFCAFICGG